MAHDHESPEPTHRQLKARVQQLEQELARLKNGDSAQRDELAGAEHHKLESTQHSELESARNIWLIEIIKGLQTDYSETSIFHTLHQLGELFILSHCSLWRRADTKQPLEVCEAWQNLTLNRFGFNREINHAWLNAHLPANLINHELESHGYQQLCDADLPADFRRADITQALLLPITREHQSAGLLVLLGKHPVAWNPTDLEHLRVLAGLLFNLQDRHQLLRTLANRDIRFQYAMDASRDGLWDWNTLTGEMYFSPSYLRMLGYRPNQFAAHIDSLRNYFLHPDDAEQVITQYQAAVLNRRPYMNLEFRMRHQDGSVIWIYSRAKFVEPDTRGVPRRCVGINANITDFVRAQEQLLTAKTQADMANKTKSEFLARMSHEIRTPMNAIIGLGHLLGDTSLDEQQKSYLGSMNTAAESLLHIINQVLDFSKIESGKVILDNTHFDLEQVFEKLSRLFEISAIHHRVEIIYDIKRDVPRFLRGDASRLSQIISHLITNALQYAKTRQVVVGVQTIKTNNKKVTLEFSITDFGVGMSKQQLQQLQKNLLHSSMLHPGAINSCAIDQDTIDPETNSFGLNICQHLVSLMNGRIHINSKPNKGCKISFTARFENSHIGAKTLHKQTQALNKLRALVVDDNAIARNIIASTAHSIRLHTDTCASAADALEMLHQADARGSPYHLVLMDYKMPEVDGLQATALIKHDQQLRSLPLILLISSYHRDEIFNDHKHASLVDGFLNKPVSESRLFDAISQAVGQHHPLRKLMTPDAQEHSADDQLLAQLQILLVEDNIVNQQVACGMLKKKGMIVTVVNNGREALELIQQSSTMFDVVLMDLEMPVLDGHEATKMIRAGEHHKHVPIIALTAQALRGDRERCLAVGMDGYISKPIMPDTLYRTLADTLRLHRETQG
jgi:two-component system sensor histidine kinase/response regulator